MNDIGAMTSAVQSAPQKAVAVQTDFPSPLPSSSASARVRLVPQLAGYMPADAVAALAEGMAAARACEHHPGTGPAAADRSGGGRRSSASTPARPPSADGDGGAAAAAAAAEALGAEVWGLVDILTEHLYDPDEQVIRGCSIAERRASRRQTGKDGWAEIGIRRHGQSRVFRLTNLDGEIVWADRQTDVMHGLSD